MTLRIVIAAVLIAATADMSAQGRRGPRDDRRLDSFGLSADEWCRDADSNTRYLTACDVREQTLSKVDLLDVDPGGNGGISVRGTSGSSATRVRFRIVGHARDERDARELIDDVRVTVDRGRIRASGPDSDGDRWWNVQVEIETSRDTPLALSTRNGGIAVEGVSGVTRFETSNGGVSLVDVSGDVQGRTANGGVRVVLDGSRWQGDGLNVETRNGAVHLELPADYNAELHTETRNGGLDIDFPITVSGRISSSQRRIDTTLGSGGAPLRVRTVNGGVRIARR